MTTAQGLQLGKLIEICSKNKWILKQFNWRYSLSSETEVLPDTMNVLDGKHNFSP